MKLKLLFLLASVLLISCGHKKETSNTSIQEVKKVTEEQKPKKELVEGLYVYNYEGLKPLLHKKGNKTYIVNFWATWCKPCIDELPYFEKITKQYKNVEVLLVSLDFTDKIKEELIPFLKKNDLASEVIVFDDPKQNVWIDAIDPSWSGALPATIIYNKDMRNFYEQSFNEKTLITELNKFIK